MSDLIWSPHKRLDYTVDISGEICGLGVHPAFEHAQGAWNIFWLSSSVMDVYLKEQKYDDDQLPYTSTLVGPVIGTCYQVLSDNHEVGNLAMSLTPRKWLKKIKNDSDFESLILVKLYGDAWIEKINERIVEYEQHNMANIVKVNFKNKKN